MSKYGDYFDTTGKPQPEELCACGHIYADHPSKHCKQFLWIAAAHDVLAALQGILDIGKRDMSNPKYDSFFITAKDAVRRSQGKR